VAESGGIAPGSITMECRNAFVKDWLSPIAKASNSYHGNNYISMRIEIKTKGPVKDNDIRALYLIREALRISTPRMVDANLKFAIESFKLERKV
jgi:hypothetical protein